MAGARSAARSFSRQQCLYFFPLPQGQGSLRPVLGTVDGRVAVRQSLVEQDQETIRVCHALLEEPKFSALLLRIDHELAEQTRSEGCRCGGALHRADYPRK